MATPKPGWARFFEDLGRLLSEQPTAQVGELAARVAVSVPTGRYSYWLIASGALAVEPTLSTDHQPGDRCATILDKKMCDVTLTEDGPERWRVAPGKAVMRNFPLMTLPEATPAERGGGLVQSEVRDELRNLPGKRLNWHMWYATHCLKPVVIVGTGKEHIQRQRDTLLKTLRDWFTPETAALLGDESSMTSNPDRILFHPYMVLDSGCDRSRTWVREIVPRLTVVTSWSSKRRMSDALFQQAPQLIVCNRRVKSAAEIFGEIEGSPLLPALQSEIDRLNPPGGVYVQAFGEFVQPYDANEDEDDEDVEEFL